MPYPQILWEIDNLINVPTFFTSAPNECQPGIWKLIDPETGIYLKKWHEKGTGLRRSEESTMRWIDKKGTYEAVPISALYEIKSIICTCDGSYLLRVSDFECVATLADFLNNAQP